MLVCALLFLLVACGKKEGEVSGESRTEFLKNGGIRATSVESFERSYYSAEELEDEIDEALKPFGKQIKKNRFQVKNQTAQLILTYASDEDFRAFNEVALFYGTVGEALAEGWDFSPLMGCVSLGEDPHIMSDAYLQTLADKTCLIVPYPGPIEYEKGVLYASPGVQVMEGEQAFVMGEVSEERPGILILK